MSIRVFDPHEGYREATQADFDARDELAMIGGMRQRIIRGVLAADIDRLHKLTAMVEDIAPPQPPVLTLHSFAQKDAQA